MGGFGDEVPRSSHWANGLQALPRTRDVFAAFSAHVSFLNFDILAYSLHQLSGDLWAVVSTARGFAKGQMGTSLKETQLSNRLQANVPGL